MLKASTTPAPARSCDARRICPFSTASSLQSLAAKFLAVSPSSLSNSLSASDRYLADRPGLGEPLSSHHILPIRCPVRLRVVLRRVPNPDPDRVIDGAELAEEKVPPPFLHRRLFFVGRARRWIEYDVEVNGLREGGSHAAHQLQRVLVPLLSIESLPFAWCQVEYLHRRRLRELLLPYLCGEE